MTPELWVGRTSTSPRRGPIGRVESSAGVPSRSAKHLCSDLDSERSGRDIRSSILCRPLLFRRPAANTRCL
ncbi:expressed unknown protein [Seminavis robusta]|uniref:Uncharacterized protein n=1 Tax=Seminavis robusta TaxID=568900 RepID=A0A9N8EUQ5_9STRA|nr:expressed unknown protein [Seminavis robusta]|eukprot:Sro1738_g294531.1  (71) ;mRNA; f:15585-15797